MSYKAILACDLDGTLIPEGGVISAEDLSLLRKLPSMGILPVIASGRPVSSVLSIVRNIWEDEELPAISFNGSVVIKSPLGKELFSARLDNKIAKKIVAFSLDNGLFPQVYDNNLFYVFYEDEKAEKYYRSVDVPYKIISYDDFTWDTPKILLHDEPDILKKYFPSLLELAGKEISAFFSKPIYIELVNPESGKGQALIKLAAIYGISSSMIWAMGDAENDVDMLLAARYGYAVANASESVKRQVSYITEKGVGQGALSEVVQHIISVIGQ
ncbi:HAD family hydrolase [Spirochaetia bacterium 38H-sp]|uniref:HAD family hydrolase n=1 Tax=Rarispira pelagica TaxID=3141764 RepID=A0ABU9UC78_9SPIR